MGNTIENRLKIYENYRKYMGNKRFCEIKELKEEF